jgi:hypothetical protein
MSGLTPLITRLMDKDPAGRPSVAEAMAMLDADATVRVRERRHTKVLGRQATRRETVVRQAPRRRWQDTGVAILMAFLVVFGVLGATVGDEMGWDLVEDVASDDAGWLVIVLVIVDLLLAGLLCAGIARLVPRVAGPTVAVVVGVLGFAVGVAATAFAVDGVTRCLVSVSAEIAGEADPEVAAGFAIAVITVMVLVGTGWAWESRKLRRAA